MKNRELNVPRRDELRSREGSFQSNHLNRFHSAFIPPFVPSFPPSSPFAYSPPAVRRLSLSRFRHGKGRKKPLLSPRHFLNNWDTKNWALIYINWPPTTRRRERAESPPIRGEPSRREMKSSQPTEPMTEISVGRGRRWAAPVPH